MGVWDVECFSSAHYWYCLREDSYSFSEYSILRVFDVLLFFIFFYSDLVLIENSTVGHVSMWPSLTYFQS